MSIAIRAMSFAGATVGSGTLRQLFAEKSAPEIKELIVKELSSRAADMQKSLELKQRVMREFARQGLTAADDPAQAQKRSEIAWAVMFGGKVPYNDRAALEKRAKDAVEKIQREFLKTYKQVTGLVQETNLPNWTFTGDDESKWAPSYVDEKYKDLGGYIGNIKYKERYKKNLPYYVIGIYHLALVRSGVIHEMLPDVTTRTFSAEGKQWTEYKFSDGTQVILEQDTKEGLYQYDRTFRKVQIDPLAGTRIYVPWGEIPAGQTRPGQVRLGQLPG
jgi:hypothetical protein